MNKDSSVTVVDLKNFKKKENGTKPDLKTLYKKIGDYIFKQKKDKKLILLGDTKNLNLPVPWISKKMYDSPNVEQYKKDRYIELGYDVLSEKEILEELEPCIRSNSEHTCGFAKRKGKVDKYNVYRLWYDSYDKEAVTFETSNVMEYVYGTADPDELTNVKLWGNITLGNIKSSPEHVERINKADTTVPIIMTVYDNEPKLLDGNHRLLKAFLTGEENIPVKILEGKELNKAKLK